MGFQSLAPGGGEVERWSEFGSGNVQLVPPSVKFGREKGEAGVTIEAVLRPAVTKTCRLGNGRSAGVADPRFG